jgi:glycosyltransferase involved in cell wall biosynthesis
VTITSAYTTHLHESRVMSQGFRRYSDHRRIKDARVRAAIRLFAGPAELRGYERSDHVLANYASVRDLLSASCKRGLNVRLMPYAAPAAFAAAPAAPPPLPAPLAQLDAPDAPLIACVARHDPRKGLDLLLRALADLRTAAVPFRACLVGPGSLLDDDRRLAASLGLDACVAIPGRVDDVFAYLAHADIFVLPSLEEGSGSIALLEALQAGTAIVATRCDGIPEDVTDGHDALLVEPGDAGQLRAALQALLTDPPLRRRLASAARETYSTRFSAAHFTAALTALYAECLQG